jgi:hypothetical protein
MTAPSTTTANVPPRNVRPQDIEAKLRELKGDAEQKANAAKGKAIAVGVGVVVVVVAVAFLLGKRRGTKKSTFIEVRRV